jgi:hypothetical protein
MAKKPAVPRIFRCVSCDEVLSEDGDERGPLMPLWECSRDSCGEIFVADDRECPSCNSPFTRRLAEYGCEDCEQEFEELHPDEVARLDPEGVARLYNKEGA